MSGKAGHNPNKRFLSKSILQMKFMSRSAPTDLSSHTSNRDTQWIVESGAVPERNIFVEESYMKFEDLCEIGRITSRQFNPYIEKLLAENIRAKDEPVSEDEVEEMAGVSAAEMNSRYDSLVTSSGSKRAPGLGDDSEGDELEETIDNSRRKFLKPS